MFGMFLLTQVYKHYGALYRHNGQNGLPDDQTPFAYRFSAHSARVTRIRQRLSVVPDLASLE